MSSITVGFQKSTGLATLDDVVTAIGIACNMRISIELYLPGNLFLNIHISSDGINNTWNLYAFDKFGITSTLINLAWGYGELYEKSRFAFSLYMDSPSIDAELDRSWESWGGVASWLHSHDYEPSSFFHDLELLREAWEAARILLTMAGDAVYDSSQKGN